MRLLFILLITLCLLPSPPSMATFGDSITVGNLASTPARSYAQLVAAGLGLRLDNRAVSGSVAAGQLQTVLAYDGGAQTALWLPCANDLRLHTPVGDFAASVRAGVRSLRRRGVTVLLGACLPFAWADEGAYDRALESVAWEEGAALVRFDRVSFADGTHPDDAGHAAIARAVLMRRVWLPVVRVSSVKSPGGTR